MEILRFEMTPFITNCFVVRDGNEALVVDPGEGTDELRDALAGHDVVGLVNTHGHCDHCGGNASVSEWTSLSPQIHPDDLPLLRAIAEQGGYFGIPVRSSPEPGRLLRHGDWVRVGGLALEVRHAPGHSPGHIVLVAHDAEDPFVIAGDVLFAGSIGRTDLPGGDYERILESIARELLSLPDNMVVYPGHGPSTTIGAERRGNPFLVDL